MAWKVLIVDDHFIVREGIKLTLKKDPDLELVGELDRGDQIVPFLNNHEVNLVLLDLEMPGLDGVQAARNIKQRFSQTKILILTYHQEAAYVREAVEAGVEGYLTKNASAEETLTAIYSIMRGNEYYSADSQKKLRESLRSGGVNNNIKLSRREIEVMVSFAQGLTIKETAKALNISEHTVESHRKHLFSKLNLKNKAALAVYAKENGYLDV